MTDDELPATDTNIDLVESYVSTTPIHVFHINIYRVARILRAGTKGIISEHDASKEILAKIKNIDEADAELLDSDIPKVVNNGDGTISLSLTQKELALIHDIMEDDTKSLADLPYYLHNIVCVYAWSVFEGYVQAKMLQVFMSHPERIQSSRNVEVSDVIRNKDNLIEWLVGAEIDKIGRFSFRELQNYLSSRFHLCFSSKYASHMNELYFIRNVVAHTGGMVRPDQLNEVPSSVETLDGELRIPHAFVEHSINTLRDAVSWFDTALSEKINQTAQAEANTADQKV